ncbi:MAG: molybdenum cofactor guanylyltransferase MobA [Candidatus Thiodiazotropha sp.]|jgi:molybdenum cofactor guanylyltransferase
MIGREKITGVILAGGRGRRMGGVDKGLIELNGRPLIEHVIDAISGQVRTLLINANRNLVQYQRFGYPVIADSISDFQGPLAGFLAAMETAQTPYIVTVPCDGPLLAGNLVSRLEAALERESAEIAVAHDGQRMQPVYALIPIELKQSLLAYLEGGDRKIDLWYARHRVAHADFSDLPASFININTEDERDRLQGEGA